MKLQKPSFSAFFLCILLGILGLFTSVANAASYVVGNTANAGAGSLRAAIESANADGDDSDITFNATVFSTLKRITLSTELGLGLNGKLVITGPPAGVELAATGLTRVIRLGAASDVTLTGLTIMNGKSDNGAGIWNDGTLTINNCTIKLNNASHFGGGIHNTGNLTVNNCTLTGNVATTSGGAINNGPEITEGRNPAMTVTGSTFYGNTTSDDSDGGGGAIYFRYATESTVSNCTFKQNGAGNRGGGIYVDGSVDMTNCTFVGNYRLSNKTGNAMYGYPAPASTTLTNCLFAANNLPGATDTTDTIGGYYSDGGGNVLALTTAETGLAADMQNNGGPTETYALITKGSAVNAGVNTSAYLLYDQRGSGYFRLNGGRIDSGAYESGFAVVLEANTGLTLPVGGTATITNAMLRAVDNIGDPVSYTITAGASHGTVKLNGGATGTFTQADIDAGNLSYTQDGSFSTTDSFSFTATDGKGAVVADAFPISTTETPSLIVTTTADTVATDGQCSLREAITYANSNADLSAITFNIPVAQKTAGVWIISTSSTLEISQPATITGPGSALLTVRESGDNKARTIIAVLKNSSLSGLTFSNGGSGLYNAYASTTMTVTNCVVSGNGNGIANNGAVIFTNCTLTGTGAPALLNNSGASATLENCTLSNNSYGIINNGTLSATNSTVSGNTYSGILSSGTATATNCTFSGNGDYGFLNVGGTPATLTNCTVSGNVNGVQNSPPLTITLTNCTVAGNSNIGLNNSGTATVNNSLIVGNGTNLSGSISSGSNNISTGTAADAGLAPTGLQNNGGPTKTIALLTASPAKNAGNDALAPAKDQRGVARPQGVHSDIGAYEYVPAAGEDTTAPTVKVLKPANSQVIR